MKKNTINFWIDFFLFIEFILVVFSGIVLREFPVDLCGYTVLGVPRKDFADLHWTLSLIMILFIFVHLWLHWGWARVVFKRRLRITPGVLAVSVILLVLISMLFAPVYLTKNLPDKRKSQVYTFNSGRLAELGVSFDK